MEVMIAAVVAALAFLTFMSVFRGSYEYAQMTRDRSIASLMAKSLLSEFDAHPYGSKAPPSWTSSSDTPVSIWIEGKPVSMTFHKEVKCLNGSFVGTGTGDTDVVTLTITWSEGNNGVTQTTKNGDNKQLVVQVPVWR